MKLLPLFLAALLACTGPFTAKAAPVYEPIAGFLLGPEYPSSGRLVRHTDGNFYGTTMESGLGDLGSLFRISPTGEFAILAHFNGTTGPTFGSKSPGNLVGDGLGSLWGCAIGGPGGSGLIYKYHVQTGQMSTVVNFTNRTGPERGANCSGLYNDGQGYMWGLGTNGGTNNWGTVFKIEIATGAMTVLAISRARPAPSSARTRTRCSCRTISASCGGTPGLAAAVATGR